MVRVTTGRIVTLVVDLLRPPTIDEKERHSVGRFRRGITHREPAVSSPVPEAHKRPATLFSSNGNLGPEPLLTVLDVGVSHLTPLVSVESPTTSRLVWSRRTGRLCSGHQYV